MNPYQSPMPIEEESRSWQRFLLDASQEAFAAILGCVVLLAASLVLLVVMPVAIGLAWYQFRKSMALLDLCLATLMTSMLPLWKNGIVEAWAILIQVTN
jgi:hypothetical protein